MDDRPQSMFARGTLVLSLMTVLLCIGLLLEGCGQGSQQDTCTILMYLCGSNLETKHGSAGKNIDELLQANIPANTRVVIQTGGSKKWHSHDIPSDKLCRYEVRDKKLVKVEELENASMGSPATLRDFLSWSEEHYPAERTMLVLWDHGGESASGICYDENYDMDCISRDEIDQAFREAKLSEKLNLIALDACFMASLENAAVLDDYANYLVASQEIVPSSGFDYKEIASKFSGNDDLQSGKLVCDSFMSKCKEAGKADRAAMSLFDLSKTDDMLKEFDKYSNYLEKLLNERNGTMTLANASRGSAVYGAKNICNLVDILSFVEGAHYQVDEGFGSMLDMRDKFVVYEVLGRNREGFGVSVYYPLEFKQKQFATYLRTCPSKSYGQLLSAVYSHGPDTTVSLKDAGNKDEFGDFAIVLEEGSERYVRSVTYTLWKEDESAAGGFAKLGEDYRIDQDWEHLTFISRFGGLWPTIENHRLYTEIELTSSGSATYSMPVVVNGEKTAISATYLFGSDGAYETGQFTHEYLWGGVNERGIPARDYKDLKNGDKVCVFAATDDAGSNLSPQDEFVYAGNAEDDKSEITYELLPDGHYRLQMTVTDLFGHKFASDYAYYTIEDGTVTLD